MRIQWLDSSSTSAQYQGLDGREQDVKIQPERDILDIEEVVGQLFLVIFQSHVVPAVDLRPSGSAGLDQPSFFVKRDLLGALHLLLGNKRPGSNEGHVPLHDVEQLR